jgi:hypothetical protein
VFATDGLLSHSPDTYRRLSSAGVPILQEGVWVHVGGGRPCGRPIYDLLKSELPQRKLASVCRMAFGEMSRSCSVVLIFFDERGWILQA